MPSPEWKKMGWGNVIQGGTSVKLLPPHWLIFTSKSLEKHCAVSKALMFLKQRIYGH